MNFVDLSLWLAIPLTALAILQAVYRLVIGPTPADRVVALDLMVNFGIGVIALTAIAYRDSIFLDVAIVLALVGFLATVTFAYYLEKRVG